MAGVGVRSSLGGSRGDLGKMFFFEDGVLGLVDGPEGLEGALVGGCVRATRLVRMEELGEVLIGGADDGGGGGAVDVEDEVGIEAAAEEREDAGHLLGRRGGEVVTHQHAKARRTMSV